MTTVYYGGHLYIGYLSRILDCGIVQQVSDQVEISTSQTPIPTYPAESAFTFDTGGLDNLSFSLIRVNPKNAYDPLDDTGLQEASRTDEYILSQSTWDNTDIWCNRLWIEALESLINRWQAKTDGCVLRYVPIVPNEVYQHALNVNVYLKEITLKYDMNRTHSISVTINAIIGTMSGQRQTEV